MVSIRRCIGEFVVIVDVADVEGRGLATGISSMLNLTFLTGATLMDSHSTKEFERVISDGH
jgi:hypothetical protein